MGKIILTTQEELQELIDSSVRRALREAIPELKPPEQDFGDIEFASRITGLSISTLYKYSTMKEEKNLPVLDGFSDRLRFSRTDLIAWMRSNPKGKKIIGKSKNKSITKIKTNGT